MNEPAILKLLYRTTFLAFVRFVFAELFRTLLLDNWHIDVIADRVENCLDGSANRLLINAPPRTLKSHIVSIALPVFALGRNPELKIMIIAGNRSLSNDLLHSVSTLLKAPRLREVFPHLQPAIGAGDVRFSQGGKITFGVIGSALIGRGADIIVIDDPLPPSHAWDEPRRTAVNEYFESELLPRLNNKATGKLIGVMHRVHCDDLTGHLLRSRTGWDSVVLRAIAEEDESWELSDGRILIRKKGDALHPQLESVESLRAQLISMGACNFGAQYQQNPPTSPAQFRTGVFAGIPPAKPENIWFGRVPEIAYVLHELFGEPPPPQRSHPSMAPTMEQWERDTIIQQRRLVEESTRPITRGPIV